MPGVSQYSLSFPTRHQCCKIFAEKEASSCERREEMQLEVPHVECEERNVFRLVVSTSDCIGSDNWRHSEAYTVCSRPLALEGSSTVLVRRYQRCNSVGVGIVIIGK